MNRGWFIFGIAFTITTLWISGLWSFTWGETNAENAADVILVDNHLLISGSQKSAETIEDDILLLNLSLSGTTEWARHTQVNLWDRANSVIPLSGGGFAYAGYCGQPAPPGITSWAKPTLLETPFGCTTMALGTSTNELMRWLKP